MHGLQKLPSIFRRMKVPTIVSSAYISVRTRLCLVKFWMILQFLPTMAFIAIFHLLTSSLQVGRYIWANIPFLADLWLVVLLSHVSPIVLHVVAIFTAALIVRVVERTVDCFILVWPKLQSLLLLMQKLDLKFFFRMAEWTVNPIFALFSFLIGVHRSAEFCLVLFWMVKMLDSVMAELAVVAKITCSLRLLRT